MQNAHSLALRFWILVWLLSVWLLQPTVPAHAASPQENSQATRVINLNISGNLSAGGNVSSLPRFAITPDGATRSASARE